MDSACGAVAVGAVDGMHRRIDDDRRIKMEGLKPELDLWRMETVDKYCQDLVENTNATESTKKDWMFGAINFAVSIAMISPREAGILCRKYKLFPEELIDVLYED